MSAVLTTQLTYDGYLAWEASQPGKHEFFKGQVFAMVGPQPMVGPQRVHGEIARNLTVALQTHLRGTPCRSYSADMKLRVAAADAVFYPDLFVTCDARDLVTELVFEHPTLVAQVLSDSTAAYDRGLKFAAYWQLPSLVEYVLIAPERRSVEVFRRNSGNLFVLHDFTGQTLVEFQSVAAGVSTSTIFENV